MKADEATCIAGLCHSLYGTEVFKHQTILERDTLKNIIGEESENLVYLFSKENRFTRIVENTENLNKKTITSLLQILYANDIEQTNRGGYRDENHKKHHLQFKLLIKNKLIELNTNNEYYIY